MITIVPEQPPDHAAIETLLDDAFGLGRRAKISYRYRQGLAPLRELCLVARDGDRLVGTIRAWPIQVGAGVGILIGPVAVAADCRSSGIGGRLITALIERAAAAGWPVAVLVGDPAYYGRFGFAAAAAFGIAMPDEQDWRVQALPLGAGADLPSGLVAHWRTVRRRAA